MKIAVVIPGTVNTMMQNRDRETAFDLLIEGGYDFDVFCITEDRSFFKKSSPDEALRMAQAGGAVGHWAIKEALGPYVVATSSAERIVEDYTDIFGDHLKTVEFISNSMDAASLRPIESAFYSKVNRGIVSCISHEQKARVPYDCFLFLRPDNFIAERAASIEEPGDSMRQAILAACSPGVSIFAVNNTISGPPDLKDRLSLWRVNSHSPIIASRAVVLEMLRLPEAFSRGWVSEYLMSNRLGFDPLWDPRTGHVYRCEQSADQDVAERSMRISYHAESIVGELFLKSGAILLEHNVRCLVAR